MMPRFLDSLPMILSRSLDRIMPVYRTLFQEHAITDQQWRVMRALWEQSAIYWHNPVNGPAQYHW